MVGLLVGATMTVVLAVAATVYAEARDAPTMTDVENYYNAGPPIDPVMLEVVITGQLKCKYPGVNLGNMSSEYPEVPYTDLYLIEYANGSSEARGKIIGYSRLTSSDGRFRIATVKSCATVECRLGKERIIAHLAVWLGPHTCWPNGRVGNERALLKRLDPQQSLFPYEWPGDWEWLDQSVPRYRPNTVREIPLTPEETDISDRTTDPNWELGSTDPVPAHPNCTIEGLCKLEPKTNQMYQVDIQGTVYCNRRDRRALHRAARLYYVDPKTSNSAQFLAGSWSYPSGQATSGAPGTLHRADYHVCWRGCPLKQGLTKDLKQFYVVLAIYHRCNEANFKAVKLTRLDELDNKLLSDPNITVYETRWVIDITDTNDHADFFNRSYDHDNYWGAIGGAGRVEL